MQRLFAGTIAVVALVAGPAIAADMSAVKTKVPKEPPFIVYNWTGFYVGIEGGGGVGEVGSIESFCAPTKCKSSNF